MRAGDTYLTGGLKRIPSHPSAKALAWALCALVVGLAAADGSTCEVQGSRPLRFFLYDEGPLGRFPLSCFFEHEENKEKFSGKSPEEISWGDLDRQLLGHRVQHLAELAIVNELQNHPLRTKREQDADIFFFGGLSVLGAWILNCEGLSHNERVERMKTALAENSYFRERPRDFYYIQTDCCDFKGHKIMDLFLRKHQINVLGIDPAFTTGDRGNEISRLITIPYSANGIVLDNYVCNKRKRKTEGERTVNFFFQGSFSRRGKGSFRRRLMDLGRALDGAVVHDTLALNVRPSRRINAPKQEGGGQLKFGLDFYADTMARSKLCFCPEGDTATSRRIFDAVAAGCVPVLMVAPLASGCGEGDPGDLSTCRLDHEQARYLLPFSGQIDYASFAVVMPGLPFLGGEEGLAAVARHLAALVGTEAGRARVERMREGLAAAREVLLPSCAPPLVPGEGHRGQGGMGAAVVKAVTTRRGEMCGEGRAMAPVAKGGRGSGKGGGRGRGRGSSRGGDGDKGRGGGLGHHHHHRRLEQIRKERESLRRRLERLGREETELEGAR